MSALTASSSIRKGLAIKSLPPLNTERARLSQLRFDNGAAAFLEVLDAQRDLLAAEQQRVQIQRALLSSRVSLYAALGGGSLALTAEDATPSRAPIPEPVQKKTP